MFKPLLRGVICIYTTLILGHRKFTIDKLPLTSDSGCVYDQSCHGSYDIIIL